ncbi:TNT domain-containing protein [Kitasatospora cineracea]|uniref:TNT domain-containing protein n=1 Tax=Kitasatospora cineracea TaxID=88074 RepID=UPI0033E594CC
MRKLPSSRNGAPHAPPPDARRLPRLRPAAHRPRSRRERRRPTRDGRRDRPGRPAERLPGLGGRPGRYYCGDSRLGPAVLPGTEPVATLLRGYQRFGALKGGYLSDPGTPFAQRSLTPDALNPDKDGKPHHCLNVLKPFDVQRGHTAAFYGMPGGGIQEWLDKKLKPEGLEGDSKIDNLIAKGYLAVVSDDECTVTPTGA